MAKSQLSERPLPTSRSGSDALISSEWRNSVSDYWLPADQQARLKELVEKEDAGEPLTSGEHKELRLLSKRHERLMVKRANAMLPRR